MRNSIKTTTYSLDWDVVMNLESRMIRDFQRESTSSKGIDLLMISIGSRLGLRVIDNLNLKWEDLIELEVGERFVRIEKKTDKERVLVMSSKLKEVLQTVYQTLKPGLGTYICTSQKGRGRKPMTIQCFNRRLKCNM